MSQINDLLAKIAEPETPEERDAAWNEVADRLVAADVLRSRLRETAQILIAVGAVGSEGDGPMDAEDAAWDAARAALVAALEAAP